MLNNKTVRSAKQYLFLVPSKIKSQQKKRSLKLEIFFI